MEIKQITSVDEIERLLANFNHDFPRTLHHRVGDLGGYATKLAQNALVYVAGEGERILGFIACYANDTAWKKAYLAQIAVSADCRNKGIGKTLLNLVCKRAVQYGMQTIWLEVDLSNMEAITYYTKNGFVVMGGDSLVSQLMMKELI
ncbi:GNAT family N-acetyltransferase [Paenibacillus sp. MMS18-CY102]|uniref:GNAT family N-acetyltransferase n=1 Tax=Paenibacillus sp. MMS18-CY102 TaxID=2682849 RepID=UPI001365FC5E|nr:GNAT family N-acetyltransferase [Paenibacillus sp. MMS18-CY102]